MGINVITYNAATTAQRTADSKAQTVIAPLADEAAVLALLKDGDTWVIDETGAEKLVKGGVFVDKVGGSQSIYTDAEFKIVGSTDVTKVARFENSADVPTGTEVVVHMPSTDVHLDDLLLFITATPALTYVPTATEGVTHEITISNYDAGYTYVIGGNEPGSTLTRNGAVISYTSSNLAVDTAVNITVTAEDTSNNYSISAVATAALTVLFVTTVDDTTDTVGADDGVLLYQGADMVDTYYKHSDEIRVDSQKLKTSRVAYNAIAYTGNGTSQDIVNGIEMNLDGRLVDKVGGQVWVKSRGATGNNAMYNTLTGANKHVITNSTTGLNGDANWYANFLSNGFSVTGIGSNAATTQSSWSQRTTKYTNGYTNHGKYYEIEINPDTGFFQGVYEGSGTAGHEVPNPMDAAVSSMFVKDLDQVVNWQAYFEHSADQTTSLNLSNASGGSGYWGAQTADAIVLAGTNGYGMNDSGNKHYFYGFVNTAGKVKVGTYAGTGSAGNVITGLGFDPAYLMVKRTDSTDHWYIFDAERADYDNFILANEPNSEYAGNNFLDTSIGSFTLNGADINASGGTYLYIAIADHDDFETTLYTGNGGTQDVSTGLNMDVVSVLGSELMTNSTFDTDVVGLTTDASAVLEWDAGRAKLTVNSTSALYHTYETLTTIPGVKYKASFDVVSSDDPGRDSYIDINDGATAGNGIGRVIATDSRPGTYNIEFIALSSQTTIGVAFNPSTTGKHLLFDNFTAKEVLSRTHAKIPGGLSWIKGRTVAENHALFDTLRGPNKHLRSDQTGIEAALTGALTAFNKDGFTLGGANQQTGNGSAFNYINWSWGTTHEYKGVTNHGKPYTCAFNPISGFTIVKYTGSGVADHEIPHHLGRALNFVTVKNLEVVIDWVAQTSIEGGTKYLRLAGTDVSAPSTITWNNKGVTADVVNLGTYNASNGANQEHIMYGWATSMTQEVIEYEGTGVAGNFIKTAKKPAYVMVKRLDVADEWIIQDNKRGASTVWANLSNAEGGGYNITISEDGFVHGGVTATVNASGGKYLAFVMYDTDEDTNGSEFY